MGVKVEEAGGEEVDASLSDRQQRSHEVTIGFHLEGDGDLSDDYSKNWLHSYFPILNIYVTDCFMIIEP